MQVPYPSKVRNCLILCLLLATGCTHSGGFNQATQRKEAEAPRKSVHILTADRTWQLDSPDNGRFDASGLVALPGGELLTINDRNSDLFKVLPGAGSTAQVVETGLFPTALVGKIARGERQRYDSEGIARDEQGRLYICEEADRAIYRWDGQSGKIELLEINWAPVTSFFRGGINASFEGVAVGDGRLYVANERSNPVIIAVDLETLTVVDHFIVRASGFALGGPHYSGLSWFEGHLYILDRNHRAILQVNPATHELISEFSFREMELAEEVAYKTDYPTGTMEGLAVTPKYFWLVTDNNGRGRRKYPSDPRPTLFRCLRPE